MLSTTDAASGGVPAYRLTFTYNGASQRVTKKVETWPSGGSSWSLVSYQGFVYDGWNMVMSVNLTETGNPPVPVVSTRAASYVWGPDLGSVGTARSDWQKAGGVGGLLMVVGSTTAGDYFPLHDRMGNIVGYRRAAVSPDSATDYNRLSQYGAVYDYDAFGRETRSAGPAADSVPFHFSSKLTDAETGLNYYSDRFYDPVAGRWLNRDPIGEKGGKNLLAMASNNAVNKLDLLGLFTAEDLSNVEELGGDPNIFTDAATGHSEPGIEGGLGLDQPSISPNLSKHLGELARLREMGIDTQGTIDSLLERIRHVREVNDDEKACLVGEKRYPKVPLYVKEYHSDMQACLKANGGSAEFAEKFATEGAKQALEYAIKIGLKKAAPYIAGGAVARGISYIPHPAAKAGGAAAGIGIAMLVDSMIDSDPNVKAALHCGMLVCPSECDALPDK